MKIRSYRGKDLGRLYETIYAELGPQAVVVCPESSRGAGGMLGGRQHELIAVVDDATDREHALRPVPRMEELQRLLAQETARWQELVDGLNALRAELRQTLRSDATALRPVSHSATLSFAADWDPRFRAAVEADCADFSRDPYSAPARVAVLKRLHLETAFQPQPAEGRPHVMVFVGPTGVGKTTTLAKLAARWSLRESRRVGILTLDTYRVAAVDQIREYGTLLGVDVRVAFSSREVERACATFSSKDLILVDTPGRNPRDPVALAAIHGALQGLAPATTFLLIPAGLHPEDAREMVRCFQRLHPTHFIVTKTDETRRASVLTLLAMETTTPVAFVTNGQRVPEDLLPADPEWMLRFLCGHAGKEATDAAVKETAGPPIAGEKTS